MKKTALLALLAIYSAIVSVAYAGDIVVKGKIDGIKKGRLYMLARSSEENVDTLGFCDFKNGKFELKVVAEEPLVTQLVVSGYSGGFMLIAEPGVTYKAFLCDSDGFYIKGGSLNENYTSHIKASDSLRAVISGLQERYEGLRKGKKLRSASLVNDTLRREQEKLRTLTTGFLASNDNVISAYTIYSNAGFDLIILGRGGGSIEDLWPFNEEIVARAIYNSEIPIISAVGHETDFTIADFIADLRAPTPSAAAELANPDIYELKNKINVYKERFRISLKKKLELMKLQYDKVIASRAFTDPLRIVNDNYLLIDKYVKSIENSIKLKQKEKTFEFAKKVERLDALSPLKTLTRGYCFTEKDGQIINSSKLLNKDDEVELKFFDGTKNAIIKE